MSPSDAANEYALRLAADIAAGLCLASAASFSREYEDSASADDFDAFLRFIDLYNGSN